MKKILASVSLIAAMLSSISAEARQLKMSLWFSESHFMTPEVFIPFAKDVAAGTNGELEIVLFGNSVLGKISDQLMLVENGIADIAMVVPSYTAGRFPLTESGSLPFAFDNASHGGRVYRELQPYVEEEFDTVKFLFMTVNTAAALLTSKRPIDTVEKIRGARISGSGAAQQQFLAGLGAVADFMPISEKYVGLERGTIEGLLMPLASAPGYKMEEVTTFISRINYSSTPLAAIMNLDTWDSLTPEQQRAVTEASDKAQKKLGPAYDAADEEGLKILLKHGGIIADFAPAELEKLHAAAAPFWDKYLADLRKRTDKADEFIAALRVSIDRTRAVPAEPVR
ncbi:MULTISPECIES: TRAP transporter substrate-binding protein [unclassified Chelatococcus]|uniref:TRAP transporter substrate-binding protein n=1 Tax=unclassified Chelatococcus TaxID=2638111 RepID=UPI001BCCE9D4|nr:MULTISPECIES: TRAP transporter substrate-binding protein [unclassified Chelatococcus]CAH1655188.1 conserved exported hypothetical protein [Hyphomicrobiales bacterium]MBS7742646.1 TRAP transporter substrate-binding protein [Chelatococcus sp. HY11]MBX3542236.1 TRAP transporter substrate-binding protein [Chelatococcus sp.]MCO5075548.1 TRAP transporter substrate-binding protein [Chelatococcus sp.]CAH1695363.1 conserved exported hypothetical protein [Hyphomicrobiales bacterium]